MDRRFRDGAGGALLSALLPRAVIPRPTTHSSNGAEATVLPWLCAAA
jgi:hypothetical protein